MLLVLLAALHDFGDAFFPARPSFFAAFCLAASIADHLLPSCLHFSSGGVLLLPICGLPWFPEFHFADQVSFRPAQFLLLQLESGNPAEFFLLFCCIFFGVAFLQPVFPWSPLLLMAIFGCCFLSCRLPFQQSASLLSSELPISATSFPLVAHFPAYRFYCRKLSVLNSLMVLQFQSHSGLLVYPLRPCLLPTLSLKLALFGQLG